MARHTLLRDLPPLSQLTQRSSSVNERSKKVGAKADTAFGDTLNDLLGAYSARQKVSEEDLFAATLGQQIKEQLGDEAYGNYRTVLKIAMTEAEPGRSGPSSEYAARETMHYLVQSGVLSKDQSRAIRQFSRQSAQLDDDHRLFDNNAGGPGDDSKAVAAFSKVEQMMTERFTAAVATGTVPNLASLPSDPLPPKQPPANKTTSSSSSSSRFKGTKYEL